MKKITIIFIIVFCLLSFVGVSCLTQDSWGKAWNSISYLEKQFYLVGMTDGLIMCISDFNVSTGSYIVELEDPEERMILTASMSRSNDLMGLISSNSEVIINIMDDLYEDPANIYILSKYIYSCLSEIKRRKYRTIITKSEKKGISLK